MRCSRVLTVASAALLGSCAHVDTDALTTLDMVADRVISQGCSTEPQITERPVTNRHVPGLIDHIKTVQCSGVFAEIYVSSAASNPSGLPIYLEVTQTNLQIPAYLNIGAPVGHLVRKLGAPSLQEPGIIQYQTLENTDSVTFRVSDGQVASIRWDWYVD